MISREFKFRYANEIAGLFVILAALLLVLGMFFAARSQGWFAPRMTVSILFGTPEGTFGLQEDAPVLVRNTTAGRVLSLNPTEEGQIRGELRIRQEFQRFLTKDGSARIKRKFGVAGDAYVELVPGTGEMLEEGDILPVVKDEELMEIAQRVLKDVQEGVMPVVAHVETILSNTASILQQVETGQGVAGAVISDSVLRDHVKGVVGQAESATKEIEYMLGDVSNLVTNEIRSVMVQTAVLERELRHTLRESRRVVEALQRHWLIRRYVEADEEHLPLMPGAAVWEVEDTLVRDIDDRLEAARRADDAAQLVRAAYNRAVLGLSAGNVQAAEALLWEGLLAARRLEQDAPLRLYLLQAELNRKRGNREQAWNGAQEVLAEADRRGRKARPLVFQAHLILLALSLDAGNLDMARTQDRAAKRVFGKLEPDSVLEAALMAQEARLAFAEGQLHEAAQLYLKQAEALRRHSANRHMADALLRAGDLFMNAQEHAKAGHAYVRAATSMLAHGDQVRGRNALALAQLAAENFDDPILRRRIEALHASQH